MKVGGRNTGGHGWEVNWDVSRFESLSVDRETLLYFRSIKLIQNCGASDILAAVIIRLIAKMAQFGMFCGFVRRHTDMFCTSSIQPAM